MIACYLIICMCCSCIRLLLLFKVPKWFCALFNVWIRKAFFTVLAIDNGRNWFFYFSLFHHSVYKVLKNSYFMILRGQEDWFKLRKHDPAARIKIGARATKPIWMGESLALPLLRLEVLMASLLSGSTNHICFPLTYMQEYVVYCTDSLKKSKFRSP
jgi:hypothetical protein